MTASVVWFPSNQRLGWETGLNKETVANSKVRFLYRSEDLNDKSTNRSRAPRQELIPCGRCAVKNTGHSATAWCKEHYVYLCDACLETHVAEGDGHGIHIHHLEELRHGNRDGVKKIFNERPVNCHRHDSVTSRFCRRCEELVCAACITEAHEGHVFKTPEEAAKLYRAKFDTKIKSVEVDVQSLLKRERDLGGLIQDLEEKQQEDEKLLDETYEEIIAHVIAEKEKHKRKLRRVHNINADRAYKDKREISNVIKQLEKAINISRQVMEDGSSSEFLSVQKLLSESFDNLTSYMHGRNSQPELLRVTVDSKEHTKAKILRSISHLHEIEVSSKQFTPVVVVPSTVIKGGNSFASITHFGTPSSAIDVEAKLTDQNHTSLSCCVQRSNDYTTDIGFKPKATGDYTLSVRITLSEDSSTYSSEHRLRVLDNNPIKTFGAWGSSLGKFQAPMGITYSAATKEVFVADANNARVQVTNQNGVVIRAENLRGSSIALTEDEQHRGLISRPYAVTTDRHGHILVADFGAGCIFVFTIDGEYIRHIGCKGDRFGQLTHPVGITVNNRNDVAVCNFRSYVQWYDVHGRPLRRFASCWGNSHRLDGPRTLCFDNSGYIVVLDRNCVDNRRFSKIKVYTPDERLICEINGGGSDWESITVDDDGHVFVTDYKKHLIHKYRYR
ncbi:E3 ubiquitin-protein ligase TRIM71-like [Ptychodera flava]|uniref:E3 ubiquitin-protein ligase TRIM71-like n=1 Tax=Ptychodera flava TaxID=63121 RepID=UPI003969DF99